MFNKVISIHNDTKVHVIIPVYKNDNYRDFSTALGSIQNQTYGNISTTVAVDGPVGKELDDYLKTLEELDELKVVRFRENRGLPTTLNATIEPLLSQGAKYIARMDADDISDPTRIEKQMSFLSSHPEVDIVGTAMREIDAQGAIKKSEWFYPTEHLDCYKRFEKGTPVAHATVIFRNSFFDKAGLYPVKTVLAEDMDMWTEGLDKGAIFGNLQEILYSYRITDNTFQRRKGLRTAISYFRSRLTINKRLEYGFKTNVYHAMRSVLMVMPTPVLKFFYENLRPMITSRDVKNK